MPGKGQLDQVDNDEGATLTLNTMVSQIPQVLQPRKAMLEIRGGLQNTRVPLQSPQLVIGRAEECDLPLPDHFLSAHHARILVAHNFYYIQDLESRNGTAVNGKPVHFIRLADGDILTLGKTQIRFLLLDHEAADSLRALDLQAVQSLALAVEAKDPYTKGHSERVAEIARRLAIAMGFPEREVARVHTAGILHDIGKIGVPEDILHKQGKLSDEEYSIIRQHPVDGHNILKPLDFLADILPAVYHHHEQYDGTGYPDRLSGDAIPLWSRLLQVADTFDAMTSTRPYRIAMDKARAIDEIIRCSGTQFDPEVVKALMTFIRTPRL